MPKQLKLKFKKTLKKADFIHADLEFHQELIGEAKRMFASAVEELLNTLSAEEHKKLNSVLDQATEARLEEIKKAAWERNESEKGNAEPNDDDDTETHTAKNELDLHNDPHEAPPKNKSAELKKLFHKIAALTHPDKIKVSESGRKNAQKLEKIFKKALDAYTNHNWYILYSIAIDLDIEIAELTEEHVMWVEEDIRETMAKISIINNLLAWIWYTGDDDQKLLALKDYFYQTCGYVPEAVEA